MADLDSAPSASASITSHERLQERVAKDALAAIAQDLIAEPASDQSETPTARKHPTHEI